MVHDPYYQRKQKKPKCYELEDYFSPQLWYLALFLCPNTRLFAQVVKTLHEQRVHDLERFVIFYICYFIDGVKDYTHIPGAGEKTKEMYAVLFMAITGFHDNYENAELDELISRLPG